MIGVQKWTTTKGAPSLVFFCNFLLNDQSGRPGFGSESRISSTWPAAFSRHDPCLGAPRLGVPLDKTIVLVLVVVLRSRFSCGVEFRFRDTGA